MDTSLQYMNKDMRKIILKKENLNQIVKMKYMTSSMQMMSFQ